MKKIYQVFRQSFKAIFRNKGRSFLTILGIIIGIGSVIALISLGNGVKVSISKQIATLGTTNLTITPGQSFGSSNTSSKSSSGSDRSSSSGPGSRSNFVQAASTLTVADLNSLQNKSKNPDVRIVSGTVAGSSIYTANGQQQRYTVNGVSPTYFDIRMLSINHGKIFGTQGINTNARVAVVGSQFARDVLGTDNPVDKTIQVNNIDFQVIGVLKTADESSFLNPNIYVYIPYTSAMQTFSTQTFSSMTADATNDNTVDAAKNQIETTLLKNHNISNKNLADFSVNSSKDLLSTVNNITSILTSLLAGIAAISLVVGGIGIMNIMLVSVTERTREIGLRKAVGAKTSDILGQFIIEAIILTITGGLLGIGLGKLIGIAASKALNIQPVITPGSIMLAVGVSTAVGLIFGIYPAAKASRLNPIDALRYE